MTSSDSPWSFRQHLLDRIDRSGLSDYRLSLLASGHLNTVRHLRQGHQPRLHTIEALCRALGLRLQMVPLDEPVPEPDGAPAIERQPEWARQLRKEIRQNLLDVPGRDRKGRVCDRTDCPGTTGKREHSGIAGRQALRKGGTGQ